MEPRDETYRHWIFTVPNVICMLRTVLSVGLIGLALAGSRGWFVALFIALSVSDWIDGHLARWLHQRSDFGARLDSIADSALYAAMLVGIVLLCHEVLRAEYGWLSAAVTSYAFTTTAGLVKYRRIPSYHTQAAKKTQALVLISVVLLVLEVAVWPIRVASLAVVLTNLEATLLTALLPTWQTDVRSILPLLKKKQ